MTADLAQAASAAVAVPAGKQWVIRNIIGIADSSGSQAVAGIYAPNPHTVAVAVQAANSIQVFNAESRIVLLAGETLKVQSVAGVWHLTVTGYEFDA